jgi:class 3 adenylate cyclase/tetratricopeptide (TPR) repeat protein
MICPVCQTPNPPAARFCFNCGASLSGPRPIVPGAGAPTATAVSASPVSASTLPASIEGERRFITVLFCDVVGSTAIGEQLDPEQVTEIMNGAFAVFNTAVAHYDGTIARLMGDAILALFGAPLAHEDDAERAVRAGLEILEAAAAYGQTVRATYGVDFDVRVGIHSGLAVLAFVGDELKTEYTAMGDTTNVAARLQGLAEPGTVLLSAETYRLVAERFDFAPRGEVEVKGKAAPVETYQALALRESPARSRGSAGFAAPLFGRERELEELGRTLRDLRNGRGSFMALVGEAGVGKSRLVEELCAASESEGADLAWLEARAVPYGDTTAHDLWHQLLGKAIGASTQDTPEGKRGKLHDACDRWGIAETERAFLEAILAVESPASQVVLSRFEGGDMVSRMHDAIGAFLVGLAHAGPTVVVLDDLHWADVPSLDLLVSVAPLVAQYPIAFVCALRPEKQVSGWTTLQRILNQLGERAAQVDLEPLTEEHAAQLLESLLDVEDLPPHTRALILAKSDGNPLFLEEVTHELVASGHMSRENGRWRAQPDIANVPIPDTLSGLLSARIDRLDPDAKRVLQAAAVIGRTFAYRVLSEIEPHHQPGSPALDACLERLTHEDLVRPFAHEPEVEYIFKHALTQEAAYSLLLMRRRKALHRQVGEALERLYPERREELASALAHHFWHGEEWERAAAYEIRAGARAAKVYALQEAMERYGRAYDALQRAPSTPPAARYDVILAWAPIAFKFRPAEEVIGRLQEAEQIARALDDRPRLAQALVWTANVHFLTGFRSRGLPALLEAYELSRELDDERLSILPMFLTTALLVDNDPRGSLQPLADVVELAHRHGMKEVESHALATRSLAHARLGETELARTYVAQALELVPTAHSLLIEADVEMTAAWVYFELGETERALGYGRSGARKALQVRGLECACDGFYIQGLLHLHARELTDALTALRESFLLSQFAGFDDLRNRVRAALGIAEVLAGQKDQLADVEASLASARTMGDGHGAAIIEAGLGDAYAHLGDLDRAEQHYLAALASFRQRNIPPSQARTLETMAALYERQGRAAEAEAARREAAALKEALQNKVAA